MEPVSLAVKVSRPRFWLYTAGTYVVGYAMGMASWTRFLNPLFFLMLFYFFLPANVFLYGVNDYYDEPTDRRNPKKGSKEHRMAPSERTRLRRLLLATVGGSVLVLPLLDVAGALLLLGFLALAFAYSAKPLRFKATPVLDFTSNTLYLLPGVLGYFLASRALPPVQVVIAGVLHTSAMHLFSAIPDIAYDAQAGLRTTAVWLRPRRSLLLCLALWAALALLTLALAGFHPLSFLVLVYPAIPLLLLLRRELRIERVYWTYPLINTSLGGLLFAALTLTKL